MTLRQSLPVLRRWWWVVVAGVVIGVAVGWVSAPGPSSTVTTYQATHTLLLEPGTAASGEVNHAAVLATMGAVPDRVAARLGLDRAAVQSMVSAGTHDNEGEVLITARSPAPAQAEALANDTAEELIAELGGPKAPIRTLEPAVASPVPGEDVKGPTSRPGRALLLGGFGLALGIAAAFAVERFDNRVRAKGTAEDALGGPVLAEVPALSRSERDQMISTEQPSPFIEAYRGLRSSIVRAVGPGGNEAQPRVIVVTSATGGEGKTTTVAHLAATLAEIGHSVVAVSADLRRPRLHQYFDRPQEPGLSDVLRGAPDVRRLSDLNTATGIRGIRFLASGAAVRNPAPLIDQLGDLLKEARELGDFVLVDTPPLLVAGDAVDVARQADAVLLVVRAGRTSIGAAARCGELLERLDVPLLGVVLVGGDGGRVRT